MKLIVNNCKFDESGEIAITSSKVGSLAIENNKIQCAYPIVLGAISFLRMSRQDRFINNLLYNYVEGCLDKSKNIERFEDYQNSIIRIRINASSD